MGISKRMAWRKLENRLFLLLLLALGACGPHNPPAPPPLAISESRPIEDLHRRTIGFLDVGVWISNEFDGARVSDAWQEGDNNFVVQVRPENAPINNSAWYAFKVWSKTAQTIQLRLTHETGALLPARPSKG